MKTKLFALATLGLAGIAFAQSAVVYDQTTHTCTLAECNNAQLITTITNPDGTTTTESATLSYVCPFQYMGQQNLACKSVALNGVAYTDGIASINYLGHTYLFSHWEMIAHFDSGHGTLIETFSCYRGSCGAPHSNQSGEVVVAQ